MNTDYDMVVLSPHFDDAIFSVGQHLIDGVKEGKKIKVINIFTKEIDKYRNKSDLEVMKRLGVERENWGFVDGGFRLSDKKMLFGGKIIKEDSGIKKDIEKKIKNIRAKLVLAPRGVGGHVDHVLIREVAKKVGGEKVQYYVDLPYLWSNINWFGEIKSFKLGSFEKIKLAKIYGREYSLVVRQWVKLMAEMIVDY